MGLSTIAAAVGRGLFAGAIGTAAMTVSSTIEMKLRNREASNAPADAFSKVLGIEPVDEAAKERLGKLVHWGYGTGWGAVPAVLDQIGLSGLTGLGAHFGALWGSEVVMLPTLDVSPPITEWGEEEIAIDVWHHLVYVIATALAYRALRPEATRREGLG